MNQWLPESDEPPMFGLDRSKPILRVFAKRSLWWRMKARIIRWLGGDIE